MFALKGPGMRADTKQYAPNFPLEHALKDMKFAQQLGEANGVRMTVSKAATGTFTKYIYEASDAHNTDRYDGAQIYTNKLKIWAWRAKTLPQ